MLGIPWYILALIAVIAGYLLFKKVNRHHYKAAHAVGNAINIKPQFVEDMIAKMGPEKGNLFSKQISAWQEKDPGVINQGVTTFFIYQIIKNDHPDNVKWWQGRLDESGYSYGLNMGDIDIAFMFLSNIVNTERKEEFLEAYNRDYM